MSPLLLVSTLLLAVRRSDNGDGTYSNPVMPNAHWSDPSVVRVDSEYFVVTSSIETTPQLQILHSTDLVNWDVVGSVLRYWPEVDPTTGTRLSKRQCWSPRLMHINGRFRVMWHSDGHFLVAEAQSAAGPWGLVKHNLTDMNQPPPDAPSAAAPGPQWAATTFVDRDHRTYIYACNWIQETDARALRWLGERTYVADMRARGVGLMENPSLMLRDGFYYWHESTNGTVTWGLSSDPNGGRASSDESALAVWRASTIRGPYEGPRHVVLSNVDFTCVNTGTVVLGPDDATWWYVYDAIESRRWSMQRQMMLDPLTFADDGWPVPFTPSRTRKSPPNKQRASQRVGWRPVLSDEFDAASLEGVTSGVLGRKWLFKQEQEALWSLTHTAGWLSVNTSGAGIDSLYPANLLVQRPTASYFTLEAKLRWAGGCGPADTGHAGIIARELNSGSGVACGVACDAKAGGLRLVVWQDTLNVVWTSPFLLPNATDEPPTVYLRLDLDLVKAQAWWSPSGAPGSWSAMMGTGKAEGGFTYTSTRLAWELVHAGPAAQQHPSRGRPDGGDASEGGGRTTANEWLQVDSFTTLHPGLFAGGADGAGSLAKFDWWRYTDNERFASDCRA